MARTSSKRKAPVRRKARPAHIVEKAVPFRAGTTQTSDLLFMAFMAVMANVLAFIAIAGPLKIRFSLTAVPILIVALTRGWRNGSIVGLLGGVVQAYQYGSFWYVFLTYILGLVAGYLAFNNGFLRSLAPLAAGFGGFFIFWSIDIVSDVPGSIPLSLPYRGLSGFVIFSAGVYLLAKKFGLERNSFLAFTLAGCAGAVAYIPYDLCLLRWIQGFPLAPALIIIAKDMAQDFTAAVIASLLLQYPRLRSR